MIIDKIYFLQQKKFYGYDSLDNENIEECMVIGYFTSLTLVDLAKEICIRNGVDEKNIEVQEFNVLIKKNQKFIYVLSHSYSIKEPNGTFTDFEYIFEPQSNNAKCIELKEKLKLNSKYKFKENRDYSVYPPDGFFVDKYKLNCIYYPVFKILDKH